MESEIEGRVNIILIMFQQSDVGSLEPIIVFFILFSTVFSEYCLSHFAFLIRNFIREKRYFKCAIDFYSEFESEL